MFEGTISLDTAYMSMHVSVVIRAGASESAIYGKCTTKVTLAFFVGTCDKGDVSIHAHQIYFLWQMLYNIMYLSGLPMQTKFKFFGWVSLFVLRFHGPVNPIGSVYDQFT